MRFLRLLALFFFSGIAYADSITDLKQFIRQSQALSAHFNQQVVDQKGKKTQAAIGTVLIKRPGKFHWRYDAPYPNEIISDGNTVWIYDPELRQVTIKTLQQTLENSPAALLAGNNHFDQHYQLTNLANTADIAWVQAIPKAKDSTFQQIRMGLKNKVLHTVVLVDQLGQTTTIVFENLTFNPMISNKAFIFVPPKGVDVISE